MYKKFGKLKYFFILHYAVNKKMRIAVSHDTTISQHKLHKVKNNYFFLSNLSINLSIFSSNIAPR